MIGSDSDFKVHCLDGNVNKNIKMVEIYLLLLSSSTKFLMGKYSRTINLFPATEEEKTL